MIKWSGASSIKRFFIWLDYGVALNGLSLLPSWLAFPLVVFRGILNFALDADWRSHSLGFGYVRAATYKAMLAINNRAENQAKWRAIWWTLGRFVACSIEEADVHRLLRMPYDRLRSEFSGVDALVAAAQRGQGVVLITAHFDSLYIGLVLLARKGIKINLMSSRIVDNERVPGCVSEHFHEKIGALERLLAPGCVRHAEDGVGFFVRALKRGEVVLIAGDGPATSESRSEALQFMGASHLMAPGPAFLARSTQSLVGAYTCHKRFDQSVCVDVSPLFTSEEDGLQKAYSVLDRNIMQSPWRWWAADLFPTYARRT